MEHDLQRSGKSSTSGTNIHKSKYDPQSKNLNPTSESNISEIRTTNSSSKRDQTVSNISCKTGNNPTQHKESFKDQIYKWYIYNNLCILGSQK